MSAPDSWQQLLVCPVCRGALQESAEDLRCASCQLRYPVVDGIPHLVAEAALPLQDDQK